MMELRTDTSPSPLIVYDSISSNLNRLAKCKNFTMFDKDLAANKLPHPQHDLTKTVELNWGLGNLATNDASASAIF
ncbi:hypothetical protein B0H67DRAFT_589164 [Lasiosphaeris hirsuta]|uniref:Uncharacterized protein n=1 Tax=Lasiosphaeris hirsuta TaxID=260670 RepID=A0AA40DLX7_9PEZI|nr:hypothetical protein B0H67DRAFT_589164 [Lasiosphaeris hirsuta]